MDTESHRDVIVKKGDIAPYQGVLVPETNYRFYLYEAEKAELLENRIDEIEEARATLIAEPYGPLYWVGGGLVLGLILSDLVSH